MLAFAKGHNSSCHIYRKAVKHGSELDCWIPETHNSNTPNINFFVADDHCFWYGKPLQERGRCKVEANNGINQMWSKSQASSQQDGVPADDDTPGDEEEEGIDMQEYIQLFCDKVAMPFFKKQTVHHPSPNGSVQNELLAAAPEFT